LPHSLYFIDCNGKRSWGWFIWKGQLPAANKLPLLMLCIWSISIDYRSSRINYVFWRHAVPTFASTTANRKFWITHIERSSTIRI
jgi:hypothetical protein